MILQIGDIVTLSSGGPTMSVREVTEAGIVKVDWFDDDKKLRAAEFHKNQLIPKNQAELTNEQLQFLISRLQAESEELK